MSKFTVKNRRIVVDRTLYTYSIAQGAEGIDLLVYQNKRPVLRLRQNWTESWGIPFFRPKVVEEIIRHYRREDLPPAPRLLCQQGDLFRELASLCFSPEEQTEKEWFLRRCADAADREYKKGE